MTALEDFESVEAEAQRAAARRLRNRAVNARADEIIASVDALSGEPIDGLKQLDDPVELLREVELRIRDLRRVAGSIGRLADQLVGLLGVHGSPSVGAAGPESPTASDTTVGAVSGVTSFGTPDTNPQGGAA